MRALLLVIFIAFFRLTVPGQTSMESTAIQQAVKRSQQFLIGQQQPEGSFSDSLNNLFETWETILVTDALLYTLSTEDSVIQKAVQWLHEHESPEQLICHNQKCRQSYCLETSALYLQLLARFNSIPVSEAQLNFIVGLQQPDGHWEVGNPDVTLETGFPSVTGFILKLLEQEHYETENTRKAREFLAKTQLPDGSWGSTWEYYGCRGYALWQCLPALRKDSVYAENADRAKRYILSSQLENGSWHVNSEGLHRVSDELQTVFMLLALRDESDINCDLAIQKGISYLLQQQLPDGSWNGGLFPIPGERYKKREYLIATALACKVLSIYKQNKWE